MAGSNAAGMRRASSIRRSHSDSHHRIYLNGVSFPDFDVPQHAGSGSGDLGVHFVGGNLEQRLVALHFVAGLLQPLGNGAFKNGLAHLRHDDIGRHNFVLTDLIISAYFHYIQGSVFLVLMLPSFFAPSAGGPTP